MSVPRVAEVPFCSMQLSRVRPRFRSPHRPVYRTATERRRQCLCQVDAASGGPPGRRGWPNWNSS